MQDFNRKKRMVIFGLSAAVVVLVGGLCFFMGKQGTAGTTANQQSASPAAESLAVVLETTTEAVKESSQAAAESMVVETMMETSGEPEPETSVFAEPETQRAKQETAKVVQTEAGRIRTPEEATPPAETPASADAAVPVENQDPNGECQPEHTQAEAEPPQGGETNPAGQVYMPGFGYIENPGPAVGETIDTDGDWNRQIGTME